MTPNRLSRETKTAASVTAMRMTILVSITGFGPWRMSIRPPSHAKIAADMTLMIPKIPTSTTDQPSTPAA